jgi:hypothetical protein
MISKEASSTSWMDSLGMLYSPSFRASIGAWVSRKLHHRNTEKPKCETLKISGIET